MSDEPTGTDRVRAAAERDRGNRGQAPTRDEMQALTSCCSQPDPNAMRANDPRWPGNRIPADTLRDRISGAVGNALICPGCLGFRLGLPHLSRKLLFGGCS